MAKYRYQPLAAHLRVVIDGIESQQAKHFRTVFGGDNPDLLRATRAAARAVLGGGTHLVSEPLDGIPEFVRSAILDSNRPRGRLDVQMELEVAKRFVPRTDQMADRCMALARLALTASPGEKASRFLSRVGRTYVLGLFPESIVMCRASLEQAVREKYGRSGKPLPTVASGKSEMRLLLDRAEVHGWLTRRERNESWTIWQRGNKAVHEDPDTLRVQIPGADRAVVEPAKVRDYLLSREHPIGRFKARVFAAAGYRAENWAVLQRDLQAIARSADAVLTRSEPYGQLFEIRAILQGPQGTLPVLTVWILRAGESVPRFVTAYPSS